jgi:hypothetical protein
MPTAYPQHHQAQPLCQRNTCVYMDPTVTVLHACRNLPSLKNPELFGPLLLFRSLCPECEQTPFACISMAWMSLVSPSYHTYTTFAPDCIDTPCPVMLAKYLLVRLISCFYLFFLFTYCLHVSSPFFLFFSTVLVCTYQ